MQFTKKPIRVYNETLASLGMFKAISRNQAEAPRHPHIGDRLHLGPSVIGRGLRKAYRGARVVRHKTHATFSVTKVRTHQYLSLRKDMSSIYFNPQKDPEISIIILAYNKFAITLDCLRSIKENVSSKVPYEVILLDNASTDQIPSLERIKGLRYIHSATNRGFVGGCNYAAAHAKGKYLVFLNNDTRVCNGWLESLYETIHDNKKIGLVGSKLLYPDGSLQEAGGIILNDGSGYNFGKHDSASDYRYNYIRDVDYCSGASIILGSALFKDLGGFDELYAPAYYEDTDLCFKIRQKGLRVVYQPASVAYHIEGATSGTSTLSGFKKYQEINHTKFLKRWNRILREQHQEPNSDGVYIGRNRRGSKRALIIDEYVPRPDRDSGSVRMTRLIECLQDIDYQVTFMPDSLTWDEGYTPALQQKGVEIIYEPFDFSRFAEDYGRFFDLVILSRPRVASYYINWIEAYFVNATIVYDTVDLHYLRTKRQAVYSDNQDALLLESSRLQIVESHLIGRSDATFLVSNQEVPILHNDGIGQGEHLAVVSNIHTIDNEAYKIAFKNRHNLTFVGGYVHPPNCDAVRWFIRDIFPAVRKKLPDIKLNIVGSGMPEDLEKEIRNVDGVIAHGYISDDKLHELLKETRVFIAPLRYGAGVKGKIGQAIEYGIPVVSTSVGAEGMYLDNDKSVLIADDAEIFSEQIIHLYEDERLWNDIRKNARVVIQEHFSKASITKSLQELLGD